MQSELRALLVGDATIAGLVGEQVVWNHLPQATERPAIVLYMISGAPGLHMQGSDGLQGSVVQIDVQALTVESMWTIRDAVVALLHGRRDADFQQIALRTERQDSDELEGGGGLIHRSSLDFDVWASA